MTPTRIVVMAKAPVAGQAKTRLAPALGAEGAARLAERMLDHAVAQARAAALGPVQVRCTPDCTHPAFLRLARDGVSCVPQGEGDLGARMLRAFTATCGATLLIGTDAPAIDATLLHQAARALHGADAVFVPAFDGGYALVGLHTAVPALFHHFTWSTPEVMALTRERAAGARLRVVELPAVADIDEPGDLAHLPAGWIGAAGAEPPSPGPDMKGPARPPFPT